MSDLLGRVGWCDVWRTLYPDQPGYSWWSNRGQAYAKDVGWRIDYHPVLDRLGQKRIGIQGGEIFRPRPADRGLRTGAASLSAAGCCLMNLC